MKRIDICRSKLRGVKSNQVSHLKSFELFDDFLKKTYLPSLLNNTIPVGDIFEAFAYDFIPSYIPGLTGIWLTGDVPPEIYNKLSLKERINEDVGVDAVYELENKKYGFVQVKWRKSDDLNSNEFSSFIGRFGLIDNQINAPHILFTNCINVQRSRKWTDYQREGKLIIISQTELDNFSGTEKVLKLFFENIGCHIIQNTYPPRPCQIQAVKIIKNNDKCCINMPCGTGKTRVIDMCMRELTNLNRVILSAPTLNLIDQHRKEFVDLVRDKKYKIFSISSGRFEGIESSTNVERIRHLIENTDKLLIIVTYKSIPRLLEAVQLMENKEPFDAMFYDESHKMVNKNKPENKKQDFICVDSLLDENIPIHKRVFLTATPLSSKSSKKVSMTDTNLFGNIEVVCTFFQAVISKYIVEPEIITISVDRDLDDPEEEDPKTWYIACAIVHLLRSSKHKLLISSPDIEHSSRLKNYTLKLMKIFDLNFFAEQVDNSHNNLPSQRHKVEEKLRNSQQGGVLFTVKMYTEGINKTFFDSCMFTYSPHSVADIIQFGGRCLRNHEGKKKGRIYIAHTSQENEKVEKMLRMWFTEYPQFFEVEGKDGNKGLRKVKSLAWKPTCGGIQLSEDLDLEEIYNRNISDTIFQKEKPLKDMTMDEVLKFTIWLSIFCLTNEENKFHGGEVQKLAASLLEYFIPKSKIGKTPARSASRKLTKELQPKYIIDTAKVKNFQNRGCGTYILKKFKINQRERDIFKVEDWNSLSSDDRNKYTEVFISQTQLLPDVAYDILSKMDVNVSRIEKLKYHFESIPEQTKEKLFGFYPVINPKKITSKNNI